MLFSASLLFRSHRSDTALSGQTTDSPLWENRIVLIEADNEENAKERATQIGKSEEHSYVVQNNETLSWRFETVDAVFEISPQQQLSHGTELFSRFLKDHEARSLLSSFDN